MSWRLANTCKIEACEKQSTSRGLCKPHYDAWFRTGDPLTYRGDRSSLTTWDKIKEIGWTRTANGCYEYNGYRNEHGYGQFREASTNKLLRIHRVVYREVIGLLRDDEVVMHLCDNPACGEPTHLQKGTQVENMRDMFTKNRDKSAAWTHCPNGHRYPLDRPKGIDSNRCNICTRERNKRYRQRKRGLNELAR